jgi:hypothetical protein
MAYELFYAFATTSTRFEFWSFLVWFLLDILITIVVTISIVPHNRRFTSLAESLIGTILCMVLLRVLTIIFPDEREQLTAYWTGILLQLPVGWISVLLLLRNQNTKGHSLEIWYV